MGVFRLTHICFDWENGVVRDCQTIFGLIFELIEDIIGWIFLIVMVAETNYDDGIQAVIAIQATVESIDLVSDVGDLWRKYCKFRMKHGTEKGPCCIRRVNKDVQKGSELQFNAGRQII